MSEELLNLLLIKSCHENKLEDVKACLTLRADVNSLSQDGHWTPLTYAAFDQNLKLLEILLAQPGLNVNKTSACVTDEHGNPYQNTALMVACHFGYSAVLSRLIQVKGIDVNVNYQDVHGITGAMLTIERGHTECLKILAKTGRVNWNMKNRWGLTPLHRAIHQDVVDIVVQDPNIDFNVRLKRDLTLAHAAVWVGSEKCVEALAAQEKFDVWNVPDVDGVTPLEVAIRGGKMNMVQILLECPRVDLNFVNKYGNTPLMMAIKCDRSDIAKVMMKSPRVDMTIRDREGSSITRIPR